MAGRLFTIWAMGKPLSHRPGIQFNYTDLINYSFIHTLSFKISQLE